MYKFRIHTVCKRQKTDCKHKKNVLCTNFKKPCHTFYCLLTPAADNSR